MNRPVTKIPYSGVLNCANGSATLQDYKNLNDRPKASYPWRTDSGLSKGAIKWQPNGNILAYSYQPNTARFDKRSILSEIARFYEPYRIIDTRDHYELYGFYDGYDRLFALVRTVYGELE